MSSPTSLTLNVPGACLYYEVQGSGPALMLVGHPMGASGFAAIAPLLAEDYTVVTFDPRGFARSTIDDPDQDAEPDLLADDARRVLEAVGEGPAHVFGSSGGAVTGLALVTHHPGHVQTLVAHEPPLALLLPEAEEARAGMQEIYDTYRESGDWAPLGEVLHFYRHRDAPPGRGRPRPQSPSAEALATSERFFRHGLLPIALYQLDFSALQRGTGPGRGRRGDHLQGPVRAAHGCRACGTPRYSADRVPRRARRFRQRLQGLRRRPSPHPGRARRDGRRGIGKPRRDSKRPPGHPASRRIRGQQQWFAGPGTLGVE